MKIEQIYTGCLAEAAYYIESNGEAAIIDPLRETRPYIEKAQRDGARIKYILETHFHADFVSGHIDLSRKTGATIVFGPTATPGYDAYVAKDGEELKLGNITLKVLHTPGHTLESSTYLLKDEQGTDKAIFTGDTLFIGDVGRPDLVQKVKPGITPEYLAGLLYDSLHSKIMPLANDVIVYPGHGAGSACGKNMSRETTDTLGHQKQFNYALQPMSREAFIKAVTDGLVAPPQYFPANVLINLKGGIESIDEVVKRGTRALAPKAFQMVWETENALVIDTRSKNLFPVAFLPGSIFIGLEDHFAPWVGALIKDLQQPILLVTDEGREEEAVIRLSRVGYDNALGFLKGGIQAWTTEGLPTSHLEEIDAEAFARLYATPGNDINLLDVRKESEYHSQHLEGAVNFPLDFINQNMGMVNRHKKYYLHCAGGFRSVIAASILISSGFDQIINIRGGFKALKDTGLPLSAFAEQKTML